MFSFPPLLQSVLGFLLLIGPLVVLHELGHYLVARWCGVKSDVFSVGFGKEVCGWTDKHGTRWRLAGSALRRSSRARGADVRQGAGCHGAVPLAGLPSWRQDPPSTRPTAARRASRSP